MFADPVTEAVNVALGRLVHGASVEEIEGQLIDCKEPAGTVGRDGKRLSTATLSMEARDEAARRLSAEVVCLAHGGGGALIIGLRDDRRGVDAVVGSDLDADWLRLRVHELTLPSLTVSITAVDVPGVVGEFGSLLVVQVPPAVELHGVARSDGTGDRAPRWRVGRSCQPMTAADQVTFARRVRPVDWSAEITAFTIADIDARVLEIARTLQPSLRGTDDETLLNRLGVLDDAGQLLRAGALLFCRADSEVIVFTVHDSPGSPSRVGRLSFQPPLLVALDELLVRMDTVVPVELLPAVGASRVSVRAVPMSVAREAIANAIAHRDWSRASPITVSITAGRIIEVVSPGGFPDGVSETNLLSHPSRPTNPTLARALNVLQISERQGVGVDLMFREMVRLGHDLPEIEAVAGDVRCQVTGGPANIGVVRLFETLAPGARDDVEIALCVHLLRTNKQVGPQDLAPLIQRSVTVASSALHRAAEHGLVEHASRTKERWRFTKAAQAVIAAPAAPATRRTTEQLIADVVHHVQRTTGPFARADIEGALGVAERRTRQVLEEMVARQWLSVAGATTGRSVRYTRGPQWDQAMKHRPPTP